MGTEAIWFTPIFKNKPVQSEDGPAGTDGSAGYHGYWITDFTQIDPHLGSNAELRELVQAAHARGMKVFFDIITNHTADVISYESNAREGYTSKDAEPYRDADGDVFDDREYAGGDDFPDARRRGVLPLPARARRARRGGDLKVPSWLNDVRYYHNRGNTDFQREDEDQQYGDFAGLDDLFTEHPRVVDGMEKIYKTWVSDIGIDGYRIDTMKHVNDEFWQEFGPGVLRYARQNGKPEFYMFGEVYDDRPTEAGKAFTSKFVTRDKMQAILDFPFQAAARNFVSRQESPGALVDFFRDDDYYTDRDSNAYQLPTFLGNHDMGRFGYFLKQDNPDADEAELLDRSLLAHELMYFVRGNPVVYYGDEQGFTGSGGDQLARQDMFANEVEDWEANAGPFDSDNIGSDETPDEDNFDSTHPLYRGLAKLGRLTERHPALRDGVMQPRQGEGVFGFSRIDREKRREYVVVVNSSPGRYVTDIETFVPGGRFERIYGSGGLEQATAGAGGRLRLVAPGTSATVYRSVDRIPLSRTAPGITLDAPSPSTVDRSRMKVEADVAGDAYAEVTFQARAAGEGWRRIGTDDNRPFRVFHDTAGYDPRTPVQLPRGGRRQQRSRADERRTPYRGALAQHRGRQPGRGGEITGFDPLLVEAQVNPERTTQRVRFERSVDRRRLGDGRRGPVVALVLASTTTRSRTSAWSEGDRLRYRAVLLEPGFPSVTSDTVTLRVADPEPAFDSVTVAGSFQEEVGCAEDWLADCDVTGPDLPALRRHVARRRSPSRPATCAVEDRHRRRLEQAELRPRAAAATTTACRSRADGGYEFVFNQTTKGSTRHPGGSLTASARRRRRSTRRPRSSTSDGPGRDRPR